MKKIILYIIICSLFSSRAITLDARKVANVSDMKNNTGGSSARSSENYNATAYEISVAKGKYDKSFLTTSLGDWLDPSTPPKNEDYHPINVIEPMEQMYRDIRRSSRKTFWQLLQGTVKRIQSTKN